MKACAFLPMVAFVLLSSGIAQAQDPVKVDPAHYKLIAENEHVRVLKITYPVGGKSVPHQHPDSIVIPLATSKVHFANADGTSRDEELAAGTAMYAPAGVHTPSNMGKAAVEAILVEFKGAPGTATLPTTRPNMNLKMLAEGPRGTATHIVADPTFAEPAGTKHDYDQVVIALQGEGMSLSINGKPAKTTWKRGDVSLIGRGEPHESKNTSGKSSEFIIVAVK
jgi:quercetin dioxygenase-like cupin family protein